MGPNYKAVTTAAATTIGFPAYSLGHASDVDLRIILDTGIAPTSDF